VREPMHRGGVRAFAIAALMVVSPAFCQVNFVSTALRTVDEADKVRSFILKGAPDAVKFIPEEDGPFVTRLQGEAAAGKGSVALAGALESGLAAVNATGGLQDVDALYSSLAKTRQFNPTFAAAGKFGGEHQRMIPWMYASYFMVANKKALPYLPKGANINALTYDELKQWAKAIKDGTGEAKLGFPAGPKGLMHRFLEGYLYPSYTGGMVRGFRGVDAEKMWGQFKDLWQYVHPRSTTYGFMHEPLSTGEVWIAFDHTARLVPALKDKPADFVAFPAPAGPKGRGYMLALIGLAIPKGSPDREAAGRLIGHLTSPTTQITTLAETGFYPVVKTTGMNVHLPEGLQLASRALDDQAASRDAKVSSIPSGLGARDGEFNKFFLDTFRRVIIRNEDIASVVKEQGQALKAFMDEAKVPCWAPDVTTGPFCTPD
jgi:multiple sugar transport system substrate-binding protein